ncbi:hypothetical protein [Tractidigestivibacter sp.]|uniref:hypothetical protein n=1 Tax=Tractidigestivibacter sp. TaxID=2847320 RepID=UPI002A908E59|nr:hypothetical protein [Tractidigestivibacter sp.]MCI6274638.1 hypothetical protein [Coriobacteriaceae bacterium]MDY5270672.1 hypothetical protein [Tractidigestivibacter sp.]
MGEENVASRDAVAQKRLEAERVDPSDQPFIRAENEDDDGYDPYSDRRPRPEPLFERDPWG